MMIDMTFAILSIFTFISFALLIVFRSKMIKYVKNNSVLYKELERLNKMYIIDYQMESEKIITHRVNTKQKFDNFDDKKYIANVISNDYDKYVSTLCKINMNRKKYNEYIELYNNLEQKSLKYAPYTKKNFIYNMLIKCEDYLYKKMRLDVPVITYCIILKLYYTSPKGRNSYSKEYIIYTDDIHKILRVEMAGIVKIEKLIKVSTETENVIYSDTTVNEFYKTLISAYFHSVVLLCSIYLCASYYPINLNDGVNPLFVIGVYYLLIFSPLALLKIRKNLLTIFLFSLFNIAGIISLFYLVYKFNYEGDINKFILTLLPYVAITSFIVTLINAFFDNDRFNVQKDSIWFTIILLALPLLIPSGVYALLWMLFLFIVIGVLFSGVPVQAHYRKGGMTKNGYREGAFVQSHVRSKPRR